MTAGGFERGIDEDDGDMVRECGLVSSEGSVDLSVIVPAYNEEERLGSMLGETLGYLKGRTGGEAGFSWEVIVVDDGSRDGTAGVAREVGGRDGVRVVRLERNCGKGYAVRAGMLVGRGRYLLMADADGATVFEEVEKLEGAVSGGGGADVAVGSRVHLRGRRGVAGGEGREWFRELISWVFHWVVVIVGGVRGVGDTQCGFKLYSREAARVAFVGQRVRRWAFDVENLYRVQRAGLRVVEVGVRWTEVAGSKVSVVKATVNMVWDMVRMRYMYGTGRWGMEMGKGE